MTSKVKAIADYLSNEGDPPITQRYQVSGLIREDDKSVIVTRTIPARSIFEALGTFIDEYGECPQYAVVVTTDVTPLKEAA